MAKRDSETMHKALTEGAELLKAIGEEDYKVEEYDATMVCSVFFDLYISLFAYYSVHFIFVYFITLFAVLLLQYLLFSFCCSF